MKYWDTVTKKDLEIAPGIINKDLVRRLNWNEYIRHIDGLIELGENDNPLVAGDHFEDVLVSLYIDAVHVIEDRYPEPLEIQEYLRKPETVVICQKLTIISVIVNEKIWPAIRNVLQELDDSELPF